MDSFATDGDVGRSNMVTKLVLAGKAMEKPIQIDVTAMKRRAVIGGLEAANLDVSEVRYASIPAMRRSGSR